MHPTPTSAWHAAAVQRSPARAWAFPAHLGVRVLRPCPAVYNVLLEGAAVLDIMGVAACTLAHGISGEVIGHPFWGTDAVVNAMRAQPGWAEGRVELDCPLFEQWPTVKELCVTDNTTSCPFFERDRAVTAQ